MELVNVLTSPKTPELTETHLPEHRERLYLPTAIRAMLLRQLAVASAPGRPASEYGRLCQGAGGHEGGGRAAGGR